MATLAAEMPLGTEAIPREGGTLEVSKVAHVEEQIAAVPVVAVASSEAASAPSKRAAKKSKKTAQTPEEPVETTAQIAATIDHPYLSFLHKRIRLYKKKLEKIRSLETACAREGKKLNDQQQEVVSNKALVEKMIVEFETLREQFIEVHVKEEDAKKKCQMQEKVVEKEEVPETIEDLNEEAAPAVELPRDAFMYVEDLLRTLHAVTLHQALGKEVPLALDYFSKVVLGTTRPPAEVSFEENLAESLVEATRYLTKSDKTVVLDVTYKDLRTMVEKLGTPATNTSEEVAASEETASTETAMVVEAPAAEELPQINFFTESQLEVETAAAENGVDGEVETEDKDNQHEALAEAIEPTVSEEEIADESPVDEEPAIDSVPVAAPPKSFADVTTGGGGKKKWNRKPKSMGSATANGSGDEKSNQRRRSHNRSKSNNSSSNSPRNADGDNNYDDSKTNAKGSNPNKPRRPRPQRSNDENSGPQNTIRAPSSTGKNEERRPRSERAARKQQPTQPEQHYRPTAQV